MTPVHAPQDQAPQSGRRLRALYVCKASYHHYKEVDHAILAERYDVTTFHYRYSPANVARLVNAIRAHDFVFAWFASPMAAVAVLAAERLGKKSIIVAGGYDVADYAPLKHGMAHRPLQRPFARYALEHADLVLPVSRFNEGELLRFAKPKRCVRVENAVDLPKVDLEGPRRRQVVTAGAVESLYSRLKGHDVLIEAARHLPDVRFVVAGPARDGTVKRYRAVAPPNVEFPGMVPHGELVRLFTESSVYAQLSLYESFGVAVAEAMWCGCTPVVSAQPALAEVVGDTGVVVEDTEPLTVARAIERALSAPLPNLRAAERAASFSRDVRRERLLHAVASVVSG
ncbi:MAG TPA: glycosyltransferase family 4 protein [Polyangiaceae bacterium]|nr:glycosyltransferase family 4 protein [Polyangiaceae bacterium]